MEHCQTERRYLFRVFCVLSLFLFMLGDRTSSASSISGTVRNLSGTPVAGVNVAIYTDSSQAVQTVTTLGDGSYSANALPDGGYKVFFDGAAQGYVRQFYGNAIDLYSASPVTVSSAAPASGIDGSLPVAGAISGRATGSTNGSGIAGLNITVYAESGNPVFGAEVTSDASGYYTITGLTAGSYRIQFSPGMQNDWQLVYFDGSATLDAALPVTVSAGVTTTSINAVLTPVPVILTWGAVYHSTMPDGSRYDIFDVGMNSGSVTLADKTLTVTGPGNFSYTFTDADLRPYLAGRVFAYKVYDHTTMPLADGVYTFTLTDALGNVSTRVDTHTNQRELPRVDSGTIQHQRLSDGSYKFSWATVNGTETFYYRLRVQRADGSNTPVYVSQRLMNILDTVPAGVLADGTAYEARVEVMDGPFMDLVFNRSSSSYVTFTPHASDYDANRLVLNSAYIYNRTEADGTVVAAAFLNVLQPAAVSSLTLTGPDDFSYSFDTVTDRNGLSFQKIFSSALPPGNYSFQVTGNSISHSFPVTLTPAESYPAIDETSLQVFDNGSYYRFSWAGLDHAGVLYYQVYIKDSASGLTMSFPNAAGVTWPNSTYADILKSSIGDISTKQWRVEAADAAVAAAIRNRRVSGLRNISVLPGDPLVTSWRVRNLYTPDGQTSVSIGGNATSATPLSVLRIDGPAGFSRDLLNARFSYVNNSYTLLEPGSSTAGIYSFTASNSATPIKTTVVYKLQPAAHPIPVVDYRTIHVHTEPSGDVRISWAPVASDIPLRYYLQLVGVSDQNGDGLMDILYTCIGNSSTGTITITQSQNMQTATALIPMANIPAVPAMFTIRAIDGADATVTYNVSQSVSVGFHRETNGVSFDYSSLLDSDGDGYADDVDTNSNDPGVFPFSTVDTTTPPEVVSAYPADGATEVSPTTINIQFSRIIDQRTLPGSITLTDLRNQSQVGGFISYSALSRSALFKPSTPLLGGVSYRLDVTTTVKDQDGNNLSAAFTSTFTTAGTEDVTAPGISVFSIPATSAVSTIAVTISASDETEGSGITGYCLSETATSAGCVWTPSPPAEYFFSSIKQGSLQTKTLYLFVTDLYGNIAMSYASCGFTIPDVDAPTAAVDFPPDGYAQTSIPLLTALASDGPIGSGVKKVEFQVSYFNSQLQSTLYYNGGSWVPDANAWVAGSYLSINGDVEKWYHSFAGSWSENQTYTLRIKATDLSNPENVSSVSQTTFTKVPADTSQAYTQLKLDLNYTSILQGGSVIALGKLTRLPDNRLDLSGNPIALKITPPATPQNPNPSPISAGSVLTHDAAGHFQFPLSGFFSEKGSYKIQADFSASLALAASTATQNLVVGAQAGYAIVVQGKIPASNGLEPEGLDSHAKTANRAYNALLSRGFTHDTINFFSYQNIAQADAAGVVVDDTPSKNAIGLAITGWAFNRMKGVPAPLYIVLVDHGSSGNFIIDTETITPADLNGWLNTLEASLSIYPAASEKRLVINGSCYSGGFIPQLSKAGRVIITSAAYNEESYKGPMEPDNIRGGEFFLEALFSDLKHGYSIKSAFDKASERTRIYTRRADGAANSSGLASDGSVQHPLLDDDGNGAGSNVLSDLTGDGVSTKNSFLGIGTTYTNAALDPFEIEATTPTTILEPAAPDPQLWARTIGTNDKIDRVWSEVRSPNTTLAGSGGTATGQLSIDLPKLEMTYNGASGSYRAASDYTGTGFNGFGTAGKYEVFYYATEALTGNVSTMKRSVVYRKKDSNTAPTRPVLASPSNGSTEKTALIFQWVKSSDPNNDPLTYTLSISRDNTFQQIDYLLEEIPVNQVDVGPEANLQDLQSYYWKVEAIDSFGAKSESIGTGGNVWSSFTTNNTNALPARIRGFVKDTLGSPIVGAAISTGTTTRNSIDLGAFLMSVDAGTYALTVSAPGFATQNIPAVTLGEGALYTPTFYLTDTQGPNITSFTIPAAATAATIAITTLAALDNVGVDTFCLSESDSSSGCSWSKSLTQYTFSGIPAGVATERWLYAFARDAAGNVSAPAPASVVITLPTPGISVSFAGNGSGTITSSPAQKGTPGDINCVKGSAAGCTATFDPGQIITLHATEDWKSTPVSWGGACGGSLAVDCPLSMDGPKSVIATFDPLLKARIGSSDYSCLQDAYNSIADNGSGLISAITDYIFRENLVLDANKTITIDGGYTDLSGSSTGGSTILEGSGGYTLSIQKGRLNVRGLKIR